MKECTSFSLQGIDQLKRAANKWCAQSLDRQTTKNMLTKKKKKKAINQRTIPNKKQTMNKNLQKRTIFI